MSRVLAVLLISFFLSPVRAQATPVWRESVSSTSPTVAVSGRIPSGQYIVVTCSTAAYGNFGVNTSATVSSSAYGILFIAGESYRIFIHPGHQYLAVLAVTGTSVCQIADDN